VLLLAIGRVLVTPRWRGRRPRAAPRWTPVAVQPI
jgi:hypothetical protein